MAAGEPPVSEEFFSELSRFKTMISVVSPPFLKAEGCRREVAAFHQHAAEQGGLWYGDKARLLKVVKTPVEMRDVPAPLSEIFARLADFNFFEMDAATGRVREFDDYEATGGMQEALSQRADEVFAALPTDRHRAAAACIFKALTERGPDGRGIRRPTRLGQLAAIAGQTSEVSETSEACRQVIEAYRVPGVTFLMPPAASALDDRTVIDISHESLMRVWRRLQRLGFVLSGIQPLVKITGIENDWHAVM
jgi:conflict system STAND superfamily ATPase